METTIQHWKNHPNLDPKLKEELNRLSEVELKDAFYTNLEFGTAGMRGLLGVGCNRLNIHTIRKANVAFARYLSQYPNVFNTGVAIAYDNRYMSYEFAVESANVLASFNIPSYVFTSLRPTPELSYAVRELGCEGGIVITASHNPKEYNGYKVYDNKGCQLIPELIDQVITEINNIKDELAIEVHLSDEQTKLVHWIDKEIDDKYIARVIEIENRPEMDKSNISLVFTPQHGTALMPVTEVFNKTGYPYILVDEQCTFDPEFPNTKSPNPEEKVAYEKAIELARKVNADGVLSTDPDADRVGIVVKHNNEYVLLTGNQTGSILIEYLLKTKKQLNTLPVNPVIFNTVVTSDLGEKVANSYGVEVEKTLTGFKFIGEKIAKYEVTHEKNFVFGYEESYGYLVEPFVRDKDAIQACLLIAECISYYKHEGLTLVDVLNDLYKRFGYHHEDQVSLTLKGSDGSAKIKAILNHFRNNVIEEFAGIKVVGKEDYLLKQKTKNNVISPLDFPASDVIKYYLEDGTWLAIRPSGTEPKCKFYFCVLGNSEEEVKVKFNSINQALKTHLE
ncbi:MAG TPA: phospho-sugar mutase [Erysipelotrichaceae bacterium]|nr:phospho-sugar mutase [Erysipelotrichaceae bacterium]